MAIKEIQTFLSKHKEKYPDLNIFEEEYFMPFNFNRVGDLGKSGHNKCVSVWCDDLADFYSDFSDYEVIDVRVEPYEKDNIISNCCGSEHLFYFNILFA